ncbi:hypothetical protein OSL57_25920, partial [Escherichia coli]|nr:hypothetical protein [Escherichia coli]
ADLHSLIQIHAGFNPYFIAHVDHVFRSHVACCTRHKGAAAHACKSGIVPGEARLHSSHDVGDPQPPGIVEVEPPGYLGIGLCHIGTDLI